jgi:hypothetical protein
MQIVAISQDIFCHLSICQSEYIAWSYERKQVLALQLNPNVKTPHTQEVIVWISVYVNLI